MFTIVMRELIARIAPRFVKDAYRARRLRKLAAAGAVIPASVVFSEIYRKSIWGTNNDDYGSPFCSGPGTVSTNSPAYVDFLSRFIDEYDIHSLVDVGCGDFRIMKQVLERRPEVEFTGIDVVPELIEYNQQRFGARNVRFLCIDAATANALPVADLITIRQVLQHLSNQQITRILSLLRTYNYALVSEHLPMTGTIRHNLDKPHGASIRMDWDSGVFIDKHPFTVPATTVLEYSEDHNGRPAVIRTSLVTNR